jgi:hypothetical protein
MKSFRLFAAICTVALSLAGATQMARRNYDADRRFELGALSPQTVLSSTAADHSPYLEDARAGVRGIGQYAAQPRDVVLRARPRLPRPASTTYHITFTARGFLSLKGNIPNAPVDPVKGSFWITLDPTVKAVVTGNAVPASLNIAGIPGGAATFNYAPGGPGPPGIPLAPSVLIVCWPPGAWAGGDCGMQPFSFVMNINNFPNSSTMFYASSGYTIASGTWVSLFDRSPGSGSVACVKPAVICELIGVTRVCRHGLRPCP